MTLREIVLSQVHHRENHPVPFTMPCEPPVSAMLDAHYGGNRWRGMILPYIVSSLHVDTLQEVKIDAGHARDGFGGIWRTDRLPWHLEKPPLTEPSFRNFRFPDASQFTDPILAHKEEAIQRANRNTESFRIISMGWGIFEQSWRIHGFEAVLMDMVTEPAFYHELCERLTDLYVAMVRACADVPAEAFLFGDDWGEQRGVIMGPDRWREFIKPCWKRIYEEVHAQGKLVFSHSCGSVADIMGDIVEIGMDVLESVQPEAKGMDTYELKEKWGDRIAFWGCIGSQSLIPFGTPDEIRSAIRRLCREAGKGGGLILAPAKPLRPETPLENAVALLEALANQE